jgi:hypothetical protein
MVARMRANMVGRGEKGETTVSLVAMEISMEFPKETENTTNMILRDHSWAYS